MFLNCFLVSWSVFFLVGIIFKLLLNIFVNWSVNFFNLENLESIINKVIVFKMIVIMVILEIIFMVFLVFFENKYCLVMYSG